MNSFIIKSIKFIVVPLIIVLALDSFLRNANSLYKEKYQGAHESRDSIEILILGNSRASYGVSPKSFDRYAYNLANINQSIYFDKRLTTSLIPLLENIKYVFISVDYHSLYFSSQSSLDIWSYYGNGIKYKDKNYFSADLSPTLGYSLKVAIFLLKNRITNYLKYGGEIISAGTPNEMLSSDTITAQYLNGKMKLEIPKKRREGNGKFLELKGAKGNNLQTVEAKFPNAFSTEKYKEKIKKFNDIIKGSNEKQEVIEDLNNFLDILVINGITPILFSTPTYVEYNKHLNETTLSNNASDIKKIRKKHNLQYWNLMDSELFEKDDFYDCDHLNENGAIKLAKILNDNLNKMETKIQI